MQVVNDQFSGVMRLLYLLVGRKPKFKQHLRQHSKGWKKIIDHGKLNSRTFSIEEMVYDAEA